MTADARDGGPLSLRACFFARVPDRTMLDLVEFYATDIQALRTSASDVVVATRWRDIPWDADVYYVWWWTWAWMPALKARIRRRRVIIVGVLDIKDDGSGYRHRPLVQRLVMRAAMGSASANVVTSVVERSRAEELFSRQSFDYLPLCVDTDYYRPGSVGRVPTAVLTIAWSEESNAVRKCLEEIIVAAAQVVRERPDVRFTIVGAHGSGHERLRALAHELGVDIAIEWTGPIDRAEKLRRLQGCALYLQPTRYEGFGLAILEAMSCGAPVVSSPVGAVTEVLGDAGTYVDGADPKAIADGVLGMLDDPTERNRLGEAARQRALALFPIHRRVDAIRRLLDPDHRQ